MENNLNEIKQLIAKGNIEKALEETISLLNDTEFIDEVLLQSSSFNKLKKDQRKGLIEWDEINKETNKIANSLLNILDLIQKGKSNSIRQSLAQAGSAGLKKKGNNKRTIIISVAGIILLSLAAFFIYKMNSDSNGFYKYDGNIDKFEIYMQLKKVNGNELEGYYEYTKYEKHIKLKGYLDGQSLELETTNLDKTEYFEGTWHDKGKTISGLWKSPDTNKELVFTLKKKE